MKKSKITYQDVANACKALLDKGEKITIRNIKSQLGGSYSTLSPLYKQWQDNQSLAKKSQHREISEPLASALLAEFERIERGVYEGLMGQVKNTSEQLPTTLFVRSQHRTELV